MAVESRYRELLAADDAAMTEIQNLFERIEAQKGSELAVSSEEETRKLVAFKVESVRKAYEEFLRDNPGHTRAMIAYGSFLSDIDHGGESLQWWLKARELDPTNPAVHNNLGNHYSHVGEQRLAIESYEAALNLQPTEPTYHGNYANALYLFRREAATLKGWSEDQVFERVLESLRKARDLDPGNYEYAHTYAEIFYGIPGRWERAIEAWEHCLKLQSDPIEREHVYTHLARVHIRLGKTAQARKCLGMVKSERWRELRNRLLQIAAQKDGALRVLDDVVPDTPAHRP